MYVKRALLLLALFCAQPYGHVAHEEESNPLLDMASVFIQEALSNHNGGGGGAAGGAGSGLAGVASLIGSFMQANGKAGGGGGGGGGGAAMQILSGLGSMLANNARGGNGAGGGFDPSIIGNVLEMFTQGDDEDTGDAQKRSNSGGAGGGSGIGLDTILQVASAFMGNQGAAEKPATLPHQKQKRAVSDEEPESENGFMNLLPLVMQAVSSFAGPEGQHTQERHKSHAWVLPPFLEHVHVLWDHFSNSELADALYEKSGVNKIMKVCSDNS